METIIREEGYPLALRETYFAFIQGSVGSNQYRKLFVERDGIPHDVIGDGDLACALYVSSILNLCGLTRRGIHTTVIETVTDMRMSGWKTSRKLIPGAVVVWTHKMCTDGKRHAHIGFYVRGDCAVSNSSPLHTPTEHDVYFRTPENKFLIARDIEYIFFHPKLA